MFMSGLQGVAIALIGAVAAVTGSYFTASATSNQRSNEINTEVQVLKNTQALQYAEIQKSLERIEKTIGTLPKK